MEITKCLEIILIEDDMNDAELTIRALKKNKMINNIIHLKDGEEAVDYIFLQGQYVHRQVTNHPTLILLDLKLPGLSGMDVLRKIKKDESTKYIPIVALTSSKEHPDVAECYRLGINSYIVKPVEFDNFSTVVTEIGFYWLLLNHPPVP